MKQLYYILICCVIVPSLLAQSGFNKLFSEDVTHISAFHDLSPSTEDSQTEWITNDMASGVFIYQLIIDGKQVNTQPFVILK